MQCNVALLGTRTPYQEVFYWASGHQERSLLDIKPSEGSHWELGGRTFSLGARHQEALYRRHKASGGSTGLGHQEALLLGTRTSGGSTGLGYQEALLLGTRISVVLCSMVFCFT